MIEAGAVDCLSGEMALQSDDSYCFGVVLWVRDRSDEEGWEIESGSRIEIVAVVPDGGQGFAKGIRPDRVERVVGAVCRIPIVCGVQIVRTRSCGDDAELVMEIGKEYSCDHVRLSLGAFVTLIWNSSSRGPVPWSARVILTASRTLRNLYRMSN